MKKLFTMLSLLSISFATPILNAQVSAQSRTPQEIEADMNDLYAQLDEFENELFDTSNGFVLMPLDNQVTETRDVEYNVVAKGRYINVFPYTVWIFEMTNNSEASFVPFDKMSEDVILFEQSNSEIVEVEDYKYYPLLQDGNTYTFNGDYNWDSRLPAGETLTFGVMSPENPYVSRYLELAGDIQIDSYQRQLSSN